VRGLQFVAVKLTPMLEKVPKLFARASVHL
jgi:hypothetical protein